jgi:hypothetical protein
LGKQDSVRELLTPRRIILGGISGILFGFLYALGADLYKAILSWSFPPSLDVRFVVSTALIVGGICAILYGVHAMRKTKEARPAPTSPSERCTAVPQDLGIEGLIDRTVDGGKFWVLGYHHWKWSEELIEKVEGAIRNRHVEFTFLTSDPRTKNFNRAMDAELIDSGAVETNKGSRKRFHTLKKALGKDQDKLRIKLFDLPLVYSMAIASDSTGTVGEAHLWPHLYKVGYQHRPRVIYKKSKAGPKDMFDRCVESFAFALSKSWEDGQPTPQSVEITQGTEKVPIPQVMKTSDRGYDPDRAARLDPQFAGVYAYFFWPKEPSYSSAERNPYVYMPYLKGIVKGKDFYYWGKYAEDLFRKGKIDSVNAPGGFENEDEMLVYLRKRGFNWNLRPVTPKDLLGESASK